MLLKSANEKEYSIISNQLAKINKRALQLLLYPETYPGLMVRKITDRNILLWRNNSLGNYYSWSIFNNEQEYYVRRILWKQRHNWNILGPQTYGAEALISKTHVDDILSTLNNCHFNLHEITNGTTIIDGIYCGMITSMYNVEWVCDELPNTCKELSLWYAITVSKLESFL